MKPYFCPTSFVDVILPEEDHFTDPKNKWITIGYSGVDGIEFRIEANKKDQAVYAFYPIEDKYILMAESPKLLVELWKRGKIEL